MDVLNGMNLIVYKFHLASRQGLNNKQSPWLVLAAPTNNSRFSSACTLPKHAASNFREGTTQTRNTVSNK